LAIFLAANFWRKIVLLSATGNLSKFLHKKQRLYVMHKKNWNEGGYCPFGGPLFWYSLDVNLVKIKKTDFVANFFKMFYL
jgi:hypothetical protein